MNKKERDDIRKTFNELRAKEKQGEIFRDHGGLEPEDLVGLIKMRICKRIRSFKIQRGLQNKELCVILEMTHIQVSRMMAIQYEEFSLDFLVIKLEILSLEDPELARTKELLKLVC